MSTRLLNPQHDFHWQGRHDVEDGALGTRIHDLMTLTTVEQIANAATHTSPMPAIALLGFSCDAGVARNQGRVGARHAPNAIRQALANMAWHTPTRWLDLGNVICDDDQLEKAQTACAEVIAATLHHAPVITLGGGHETAWASFQGLAQYLRTAPHLPHQQQQRAPVIGIINFDAHFDLRAFHHDTIASVQPSSGTPFYQIAHFCQQQHWEFRYACLGVSRTSNTPALYQRAHDLKVWYVEDTQLSAPHHQHHLAELQSFIQQCDYLYLTIDMDLFPASVAPGVSAPAARGVSLPDISPYLAQILAAKEKLLLADIAECNPDYDIDNQTARLAARLCWEIAEGFTTSHAKSPI